ADGPRRPHLEEEVCLVCGRRRPQLKRNPFGGRSRAGGVRATDSPTHLDARRVRRTNFSTLSAPGDGMNTTDSVFQRALSNMLTEIFDGPPGQEAYLLNPGDPGLLRQLDRIDASAASKRPMPGKTTIAAHIDHVRFGFSILNRWAA